MPVENFRIVPTCSAPVGERGPLAARPIGVHDGQVVASTAKAKRLAAEAVLVAVTVKL